MDLPSAQVTRQQRVGLVDRRNPVVRGEESALSCFPWSPRQSVSWFCTCPTAHTAAALCMCILKTSEWDGIG